MAFTTLTKCVCLSFAGEVKSCLWYKVTVLSLNIKFCVWVLIRVNTTIKSRVELVVGNWNGELPRLAHTMHYDTVIESSYVSTCDARAPKGTGALNDGGFPLKFPFICATSYKYTAATINDILMPLRPGIYPSSSLIRSIRRLLPLICLFTVAHFFL